MAKFSSLLLVLSLTLASSFAGADDGGAYPGYMATSDNIIKSSYGECLHDSNWQSDYGSDSCGEAPTVTKTVDYSESTTHLFNAGNTSLSESGQAELTSFINGLRGNGVIKKIVVTGYTDQTGAVAYNLRLSTERANAVKNFLVSQGFDDDTILAEGKGSQNSLVSAACLSKLGNNGLSQILAVTTSYEKASPEQRQKMQGSLDKLAKKYSQLADCTAADRRVDITVTQLKRVVVPAE